MEFYKFHGTTECDCIKSARENCSDTFARKISGPATKCKKGDFQPTKRNREVEFTNCDNYCSRMSLSIDMWDDGSKEYLLIKYSSSLTAEIGPRYKDCLLIFKVRQNGGLVKHTPIDPPDTNENPYHHDLFKTDSFDDDIDSCLIYMDCIKLSGNAV